MWQLGVPWFQLVERSAAIFLVLLIALRLFGKREVGQFTLFDLVFVLLVANSVQPAMTGPDSSLAGGLIIIVTLVGLNAVLAQVRERFPASRRLFGGTPSVVARDGHWDDAALRREGLDKDDALMALREHGIDAISAVKLVVLEPDGNISVVPKDATGPHRASRRKVRYIHRR